MRKTIIASAIFFLLFTYGLVLSQATVSIIPEELEPKNPVGFYDYKGVTNVHTDRGIGSGSPLDVIKAAQEVGLDFLAISDLNPFEKPALPEGYNRKLLVIGAGEYSYVDSRLILYDLNRRHTLETSAKHKRYSPICFRSREQKRVRISSSLRIQPSPASPGAALILPDSTGSKSSI